MVERRKIKAIAVKCQNARRGISLSNKEEENYKNNTGDEIDPDQADNDEKLLQF